LKRLILITIAAVVAGKLFASMMYKVAETTVNVPAVQRLLPKSFNEGVIAHSEIPDANPKEAAAPKVDYHPFVPPVSIEPSPAPDNVAQGPVLDAPKKKKKKKAATEEKKAMVLTPIQNRLQVIIPKGQDSAPIYAGGGIISGNQSQAGALSAQAAVNSPPPPPGQPAAVDVAYWTNLLVHSPSNADAHRFFALYTSKQITSQQYYSVLGFMQKSNVLLSRELAVGMASYEMQEGAFKVLADEAHTEANAQLSAKAVTKLQQYDSITQLSILQTAVASSDIYEKIQAALDVRDIVGTFNVTSGDPQKLFAAFIAPLTAMEHDSNSLVEQAGQAAMAALQSLNITTVAQQPTGAAGISGFQGMISPAQPSNSIFR
jgi:hypothetical protein